MDTKVDHIRKHNDIEDFVEKDVKRRDKQATLMVEPKIIHKGKALKPDLVVKSKGRVLVVVIDRHKDGDYLENGKKEKISKYTKLIPNLMEKLSADERAILPIVIGTRNALPKQTVKDLNMYLGINDKKTVLTISLMSHRSSIDVRYF